MPQIADAGYIHSYAMYYVRRYLYATSAVLAAAIGAAVVREVHRWFLRSSSRCQRVLARRCPKSLWIVCVSYPAQLIAQLCGLLSMAALALQGLVTLSDDGETHALFARIAIFSALIFEAHACVFVLVLGCVEQDATLLFSARCKIALLGTALVAMVSFPILVMVILRPEEWRTLNTVDSWEVYVDAMGDVRPVLEWIVCISQFVFFGTFATDLAHALEAPPSKELVNTIAAFGVLSVPILSILLTAEGWLASARR
jgi:hypothetical protein